MPASTCLACKYDDPSQPKFLLFATRANQRERQFSLNEALWLLDTWPRLIIEHRLPTDTVYAQGLTVAPEFLAGLQTKEDGDGVLRIGTVAISLTRAFQGANTSQLRGTVCGGQALRESALPGQREFGLNFEFLCLVASDINWPGPIAGW